MLHSDRRKCPSCTNTHTHTHTHTYTHTHTHTHTSQQTQISRVLFQLKETPQVLEEVLEKVNKEYSPDVSQLIRTMLRRAFHQRPTMKEVVELPLVQHCLELSNSPLVKKSKCSGTDCEGGPSVINALADTSAALVIIQGVGVLAPALSPLSPLPCPPSPPNFGLDKILIMYKFTLSSPLSLPPPPPHTHTVEAVPTDGGIDAIIGN